MPKRAAKSPLKTAPRDRMPVLEGRSGGNGPPAWVVAAVLAFLIAAVYGPSIRAPFIFDDVPSVTENKSIAALWPLVGLTEPGPLNPPAQLPISARPLVNLSFALNYHFGGLNPSGYRLVNLAFHFLATLLLWAIVRRTLRLPYFGGRFDRVAEWLALAAALLWGLHPLLTESVIYVTQRTELMMGLFCLATLYCSLRYWSYSSLPPLDNSLQHGVDSDRETTNPRAKTMWLTLAIVSCLAGMASKEVMVSAPLIVLLFERTFIAGSLLNALRRSWPLYAGLAPTSALLVYLHWNSPYHDSAGFSLGISGPVWWLTQTKVLFIYLRLVLWPAPLLIHYQLPYSTMIAEVWIDVVLLTLMAAATLVMLWKNRPLGFLATCFFAILSPTFVIPISTEVAAERRMYLALVVLVAIFVVGGYQLLTTALNRLKANASPASATRSAVMTVVAAAFALTLVYCFVDAARLTAYENELSLWISVRDAQPDNLRAIQYIGAYFENAGNYDAAIDQYRDVISHDATGHDPTALHAHYRLGVLLLKKGKTEEALPHLEIAARTLKDSTGLHTNFGFALFMAGHNDQAIDEFRAALEVDPKYFPARKNLAMALQKAGKYPEAIESFEQALQLNPTAIEIHGDLAECYRQMKDGPQATATLQHGLELARATGNTDLVKKFTSALEKNP